MSHPAKPSAGPPHNPLKLVCPNCQRSTVVSLDRLPQRLYCHHCSKWYRVENRGLVEVNGPSGVPVDISVRSGFSEWQEHQIYWNQRLGYGSADAQPRWTRIKRWVRRRTLPQWVSAAVVVLFLVSASSYGVVCAFAQPKVEEVALPDALESRAVLWSQAWSHVDLRQMLRLTEPDRDRDLRNWLAHNRPKYETSETTEPANVQLASVTLRPKDKDKADVVVRIQFNNGAGQESSIAQKQLWVRRGGAWYYLPPSRGNGVIRRV